MEDFKGFKMEKVEISGREAIIVHPEKPNGKWALKTEYFGAFPDVQVKLLELGYYVTHIPSTTRWYNESDTDARKDLADYMVSTYGVSKKCVIIGMSCGGMQGIYFSAKYPECVSCMYLDAPVVNLLSCPAGLGIASNSLYEEFYKDTKMDISTLIGYRNHPLDKIPELVKSKIPVILVCGDSDTVVPYVENGKLLRDMYEANGITIETIIKPGCEHHPHSLPDNTPIIEFIKKYDI